MDFGGDVMYIQDDHLIYIPRCHILGEESINKKYEFCVPIPIVSFIQRE
jgi:hypothetical protein